MSSSSRITELAGERRYLLELNAEEACALVVAVEVVRAWATPLELSALQALSQVLLGKLFALHELAHRGNAGLQGRVSLLVLQALLCEDTSAPVLAGLLARRSGPEGPTPSLN